MTDHVHDEYAYPGGPTTITARARELRADGNGARRTLSPEFIGLWRGGILESRTAGDSLCFVLPTCRGILDDALGDDDESV